MPFEIMRVGGCVFYLRIFTDLAEWKKKKIFKKAIFFQGIRKTSFASSLVPSVGLNWHSEKEGLGPN